MTTIRTLVKESWQDTEESEEKCVLNDLNGLSWGFNSMSWNFYMSLELWTWVYNDENNTENCSIKNCEKVSRTPFMNR